MEKTLIEKRLFSKEECEKIKSYARLKVRVVDVYHNEYEKVGSKCYQMLCLGVIHLMIYLGFMIGLKIGQIL
jgi:hypothetical protein